MNLRIFDTNLRPLGVVDEITSLILKTKYFNVGNISILAPVTQNNLKMLKEGNIVIVYDGTDAYKDNAGNEWRRASVIKYINITTNSKGEEQIEAKGYAMSCWLDKRVIAKQYMFNDPISNIIIELVSSNCGNAASFRRAFPNFIILEKKEDLDGTQVEYTNEEYVSLGDEVKRLAQQGKLGYDILVDVKKQRYGFYMYKGTDRTAENKTGTKPCIFSREFENVLKRSYEHSNENCKNFIYVYGNKEGDETETPVATETDSTQWLSGIELDEVAIKSDISRTYTDDAGQHSIPLSTYLKLLKNQAGLELSSYDACINFESTINVLSNLRYKKDFFLGDRVTFQERDWGIKINARITEVSETWQKGTYAIEITFGESTPTLIDRLRKRGIR